MTEIGGHPQIGTFVTSKSVSYRQILSESAIQMPVLFKLLNFNERSVLVRLFFLSNLSRKYWCHFWGTLLRLVDSI